MPSTRGRRSDAEVVAAIRTAVIEEFDEVGLGRLTMERIAQRSGIAKTSLYRRWDSPQAVLLDAVRSAFPHETVSATDDLRHDLIAALKLLVDWMDTPTARAVAAILLDRARYPELAEAVYSDVFEPAGGRFTSTVLHHYARIGRIDPARLTPVVLDIGEALVLKIAFDTGALPGERTLADIVDQAILPAVGLTP
ncbi:TetR/AcrR family transcriptional regulator [Nocardia otitidiscaviarum]|uniref:TetR/AcrR family transcriptional regulator n=1 Tax=Nocardia otitidiscaviarum TaxID=1823 RepID=A0A516NK69_9NOCA|nr:TetR/AcrR family transcriptional regulator [Nocardia otitidiscaviarum]MBF6180330.1 TetR/AcrR family transcriptional regulator [Nocardia otitidiscaviarum]MCP9619323.1 TetR/AcrR family transcriptional regulator [Nocardia otitidiscaviarum]QDP79279.1 TetR/AcrR family transcriptional regulator [Nocardia otitidiscaviarum]